MKKEEILIKCKVENLKNKKAKEEEQLQNTIKKHKIEQHLKMQKKEIKPKKKISSLKRKKEIIRKKEIMKKEELTQ